MMSLFKKLVAFDDAASSLIAEFDMNHPEELRKKADKFIDIYYAFHEYADQNEIYFSEELSKLIAELHSETFNQSLRVVYQTAPYSIDDFKNAFCKEKSNIQSRTGQIKQQIKQEFRQLLGVEA